MTNVDINSGTIDGATIATSNITVGATKELDVSAGTLTLADDQISGDKVSGGTIGTITISQLAGAMDCNSQTMTNDINSGTIDGADITVGAGKTLNVSAGTLTLAADQISGDSINNGTIDSITISQLAGAIDCNSQAMTNVDINSGTIDGVTIGTDTACSDLRVDNIKIDGNSITSTNVNGDISITPNGTGEVNISKVDIDSGTQMEPIATSDITVGAGKTLDVSAGTLTLAADQISGDSINNGTIDSITISQLAGAIDCNSQTMTNVNIDSGTFNRYK